MTKPRVLLTRRWPAIVEHRMAEKFDLVLNNLDQPMDADDFKAAMGQFDAICPTITDRLPAGVFSPDSMVQIVGNYGAGYEHIDLEAAKAAKVVVTNTPDALTDATAELAITLMLMAARRAGEGMRHIQMGLWQGWSPTYLQGRSLTGKTLGLVGFGRIAQATARKAHFGFGMKVLYHSRGEGDPAAVKELGAVRAPSLEALLEQADVVSLHCPGGPETKHLINAERLQMMKSTAILVNTARGSVVDEVALSAALHSGHLYAAGLDVFEHEPEVHPDLITAFNCSVLPHLGSATVEARIAMGMRVAENLERHFAGETPPDRVA